MGSAYHLSGRRIRFEVRRGGSASGAFREFEILSGSVQNSVRTANYLPVGQTVFNVNAFGKIVTFTFMGVLLTDALPWEEFEPMTAIRGLYVTANRAGGASEDEPDEVWHYSEYGVGVSLNHAFDTMNHQVWDCVIMADGHYEPPQTYEP